MSLPSLKVTVFLFLVFNMVSFRGKKSLDHVQIGHLYGFHLKAPTPPPHNSRHQRLGGSIALHPKDDCEGDYPPLQNRTFKFIVIGKMNMFLTRSR